MRKVTREEWLEVGNDSVIDFDKTQRCRAGKGGKVKICVDFDILDRPVSLRLYTGDSEETCDSYHLFD